jgi:hypothetical protein
MVSKVTARALPVTNGRSHEIICWINGRNLPMGLTKPCIKSNKASLRKHKKSNEHTR